MNFTDFCRAHGLMVDSVVEGRWMRVPTADHPRKKNGAYKFLGDVGFVQNHATQVDVSVWRPDGDVPKIDAERIAAKAAAFEQKMREGWARAAQRAHQLIASSKQAEHNYLHIKGFGCTRGIVTDDGSLLIPMRHWRSNDLMGAQLIRWIDEERRYEKKMLTGMRAKGAVFRIGSAQAARTWLVEGFATGLSVEAAIRLLNLRDAVLVCFSAGNLMHVAPLIGGERFVFADNDASGAGLKAAKATGLRYCMSGIEGQDANDMHLSDGIYKVASLMVDAISSEVETVP